VNRLDQETAKRRGPTRAVEPLKKKKKKKLPVIQQPTIQNSDWTSKSFKEH
jgi:hypothetical protein